MRAASWRPPPTKRPVRFELEWGAIFRGAAAAAIRKHEGPILEKVERGSTKPPLCGLLALGDSNGAAESPRRQAGLVCRQSLSIKCRSPRVGLRNEPSKQTARSLDVTVRLALDKIDCRPTADGINRPPSGSGFMARRHLGAG